MEHAIPPKVRETDGKHVVALPLPQFTALAARGSRLAARGTRHAAGGSRLAARGSRHAARGTRLAARGSRHAAGGSRHAVAFVAPSARGAANGMWCRERASGRAGRLGGG